MATQLIDQLSQEFDISRYKDSYTDNLMKADQSQSKRERSWPNHRCVLFILQVKT